MMVPGAYAGSKKLVRPPQGDLQVVFGVAESMERSDTILAFGLSELLGSRRTFFNFVVRQNGISAYLAHAN